VRIVAVLSWFDEAPSWLATCVAGIGRFCDGLVAVDGAYAIYPQGRARSHPQQAEAIVNAAEAAGLELTLHQPTTTWADNEVGKRSFSLKLAGLQLEEGRDWLAVVDADYHLLQCSPDAIRAALAETPAPVATYTLLDGKDFLGDPKLAEYVNGRPCDTEWTFRTRDLYRWNPTIQIGPAHWTYHAIVDGKRRWLRGPWEKQVDCLDLNKELVFYHRTQDRAQVRKASAEYYYKMREQHGTEFIYSYEPGDDRFCDDYLARLDQQETAA